jgi:hypothetical protein
VENTEPHLKIVGSFRLRMMLANKRTEKEDAALKIPYRALTLKEALYLLTNHCDGYFDAGMESVVLTG